MKEVQRERRIIAEQREKEWRCGNERFRNIGQENDGFEFLIILETQTQNAI